MARLNRWHGAALLLATMASGCAHANATRRASDRPSGRDFDRVVYEVIVRSSHLEAPCPDKNGHPIPVCLVVLDQSVGAKEAHPVNISPGLRALLQPLPVIYVVGKRCRSELGVNLTVGPPVWSTVDQVHIHAAMILSGIQGTYADYDLTRQDDGHSWEVRGGFSGFFN